MKELKAGFSLDMRTEVLLQKYSASGSTPEDFDNTAETHVVSKKNVAQPFSDDTTFDHNEKIYFSSTNSCFQQRVKREIESDLWHNSIVKLENHFETYHDNICTCASVEKKNASSNMAQDSSLLYSNIPSDDVNHDYTCRLRTEILKHINTFEDNEESITTFEDVMKTDYTVCHTTSEGAIKTENSLCNNTAFQNAVKTENSPCSPLLEDGVKLENSTNMLASEKLEQKFAHGYGNHLGDREFFEEVVSSIGSGPQHKTGSDRPQREPKIRQHQFEVDLPKLTKAEKKKLWNACYKAKLRSDPVAYEQHKKKEAVRKKELRRTMTEEQKNIVREQARVRNRNYRARQKAKLSGVPTTKRSKTKKHSRTNKKKKGEDERRERNRLSQQKRRANMSSQKRKRERESSLRYYYENKIKKKPSTQTQTFAQHLRASSSTQSSDHFFIQAFVPSSTQTSPQHFTLAFAPSLIQMPAEPYITVQTLDWHCSNSNYEFITNHHKFHQKVDF